MIQKILIIKSSGVLCYSKSFVNDEDIDKDFVSGFLTAINNIAKEIGGGEIRSIHFRNFNIVYTFDYEKNWIFIIVTDIDDSEEEVRHKLEYLKLEFFKRYRDDLKNWDYDIVKFESFDEFVIKNIFIPPKILLVGTPGTGKSTILELFPGETVIKIDEDMNDILEKSIQLPNLEGILEIIVREMDLEDLVENLKNYKHFVDSVDIICFLTNSGGMNVRKTHKLLLLLEPKIKKADFYVIANFQDVSTSHVPEKVEEFFRVKTYGLSAISKKAEKEIYEILIEIVNRSILKKINSSQKVICKNEREEKEEDDDIIIYVD